MDSQTLEEPLDLLRLSISQRIFIKTRNSRDIKGKLISYDTHLNMILTDAEETFWENDKKHQRRLDSVYLRGDGIILVSPISKGIVEV
jgi:U6 snRNA-associated Sm-like protein LSm3